jgi:hypothetical protein
LPEADHAAPIQNLPAECRRGRIVVFKVERAVTIPVWVLLLFAAWTLLLLFLTIGYFRWSRILKLNIFLPADNQIRVDRTITSPAILGLHRHHVRVQVFGTDSQHPWLAQNNLSIDDGCGDAT